MRQRTAGQLTQVCCLVAGPWRPTPQPVHAEAPGFEYTPTPAKQRCYHSGSRQWWHVTSQTTSCFVCNASMVSLAKTV